MVRVFGLCRTVSKTRAMAFVMLACVPRLNPEAWLKAYDQLCPVIRLRTGASLGDISDRQTKSASQGCGGRDNPHLGSLGPHHTPIPPTALAVPFALQAPSEYTISTIVFFGAAIFGI